MRSPEYILLLDSAVALYAAADLNRTLKTGRAHTWMNGTATREHQPARFWRYVYQAYAFIAGCIAVFVWVLVWPDSLR